MNTDNTDVEKNGEMRSEASIERIVMLQCPSCNGSGEVDRIIDHDEDYEAVWGVGECFRCDGRGKIRDHCKST